MCGIAGVIDFSRVLSPEDWRLTEKMTHSQVHRGPDDSGFYQGAHAALGHRRLSIIDVSAAGRQPMPNESGTVQVVYNGEIYNYLELRGELRKAGHGFRSNSDTEVLVHGYDEWGIEGLLERLRGMFAFAIYDEREERLLLARDRLGIKPLYYHVGAGGKRLTFASEVKAMVRSGAVSDEVDIAGITGFLLFGAVPAPWTTVRGVRCLPAGHWLALSREGLELKRYWELPAGGGLPEQEASEVKRSLPGLLEDAVRRHLMSDVPLGVFLSGGVDSAGLVALASRTGQRLTTLTVVFSEAEFSEARLANRVAQRFGTEHREVLIRSRDFAEEVSRILEAMDQPSNDGVNTFFVSQAARKCGLKVVLSGLGGDEVFWGYEHCRRLATRLSPLRWFMSAPSVVRKPLAKAGIAYGRLSGKENWMRLGFMAKEAGAGAAYMTLRGFFAPEQVSLLLGCDEREVYSELARYLEPEKDEARRVTASGYHRLETRRYLHDQLLRDTDVYSMAHSLEVRVPYLDHEVVESVEGLPQAMKVAQGRNKPLLADAVGDPLIDELAQARKRGFTFPFRNWMREHAGLLREIAGNTKVLERKAVDRLWDEFGAGRLHWSRAWATVTMGARG
jgi:asparagine synthase (glutamine-hydrolysing)